MRESSTGMSKETRPKAQQQMQTPATAKSKEKAAGSEEKRRNPLDWARMRKRSPPKTSERDSGGTPRNSKRRRYFSPETSIAENEKPSVPSTPEQKPCPSKQMSTEPRTKFHQNSKSDTDSEPVVDQPAEKRKDSGQKRATNLKQVLLQLQNQDAPPVTFPKQFTPPVASASAADQSLPEANNEVVDCPGTSRASMSSSLPDSENISLRVSKDCRIGPLFDEVRVRSLVSPQPLPFSQEIVRIVQDLLDCAHRPQEIFISLKVAAAGELSSNVMLFDMVSGSFERKKVPVKESLSSAMAWFSDFLDSVGCCRRLFVFDFISDDFVCKDCFLKNPKQRRTEATGSLSKTKDAQLEGLQPVSRGFSVVKVAEVAKTNRKEEVERERTLLELRTSEEEVFMKINSVFFRLFDIPEKRTNLRPRIGTLPVDELGKVALVRVRSFYDRGGNQMWKLGDERPVHSCALKKIITHSCREVRKNLKIGGTMLDLWHSLLLRCPMCIKTTSLSRAHQKIRNFLKDEADKKWIASQIKAPSCSTTPSVPIPKPLSLLPVPSPSTNVFKKPRMPNRAKPTASKITPILKKKSVSIHHRGDGGKEQVLQKEQKKKKELEKTRKLVKEALSFSRMEPTWKTREAENLERRQERILETFMAELRQEMKLKKEAEDVIKEEEPDDLDTLSNFNDLPALEKEEKRVKEEEVDDDLDFIKSEPDDDFGGMPALFAVRGLPSLRRPPRLVEIRPLFAFPEDLEKKRRAAEKKRRERQRRRLEQMRRKAEEEKQRLQKQRQMDRQMERRLEIQEEEERRQRSAELQRMGEHKKIEAAQRALAEMEERERRKREREEEQRGEGSKEAEESAERTRKEHFSKLNAFFFNFFKVPDDERAVFRADIRHPNDSSSTAWPSITSVRSQIFINGQTEMWQLGDELPLCSSVLKAEMKTHSCLAHPPELFLGEMLMIWFGLLHRCPKCASLSSLEKALKAVEAFIEGERSRNSS